MSALLTQTIMQRQMAAMSSERFDLGVLRRDGRMLLREGRTTEQIVRMLRWLRLENARGAHVYLRPHLLHSLSLIDDLSPHALLRLTQSGFAPAVVLETSPHNFQVWLNHGRVLERELGTLAAKALADRFDGDPSSADWRHFGRLAGFTNQKPARRQPNGLPPFVRLHAASGKVYPRACEFLVEVKNLAELARQQRNRRAQRCASTRSELRKSLPDFHHDPRYRGDLHRADLAWATYAASHGLTQPEISRHILLARDLSKKGSLRRQRNYAARTASKALATLTRAAP